MKWWLLLKSIPEINEASTAVVTTKNWASSASIWYQVIKVGATVLTALGVSIALSAEEIQTISVGLAVAIPTVCTLVDAIAAIWLRLRTSQPIQGTKVAIQMAAMEPASHDQPPVTQPPTEGQCPGNG